MALRQPRRGHPHPALRMLCSRSVISVLEGLRMRGPIWAALRDSARYAHPRAPFWPHRVTSRR
jgi:hypothetical protein